MLLLKGFFDAPRPWAVDPSLMSFGYSITETDYRSLQPASNFALFSADLLAIIRSSDIGRYGFPSGHVLMISSLWLGLAALLRKKWLWVVSITLVILTMISRMYLGAHYLGDVLGGLIIGMGVLLGLYQIFKKFELLEVKKITTSLQVLLFTPLVLFLLYPFLSGFQAGTFIGINVGLYLIIKNDNMPQLSEKWLKRILNMFLFLLLYFTSFFLLQSVPALKDGFLGIFSYAATNVLVILAFYAIGRRIGFYKTEYNKDNA